MPLNIFDDISEYNAHTPSSTESEVSYIVDDDEFKYDGVNVEVKVPKFGDAVYIDNVLDSEGHYGIHFIDGKSLNTSLLSGYTPVGVVFGNRKGKVYIHHYKGYKGSDNTVKWASAWLYDMNVTVDGTERSIVFRQPMTSGYLTVGTFTHSCSTQEEFAQELDTWLRNNQGGTAAGGSWNYNWHCEYMENYAGVMKPIVIIDNIVDYRQYTSNGIVASGATANANMANMIPTISDSVGVRRNNGGSGVRTGANYRRMLEYWTSNTTISNPSSMVSIKNKSDIVSKTQFENNQYCENLRNEYETYEKYIESVMILYPTLYRLVGQEKDKSMEWNLALCNRKHKNLAGTLIATFPAFNYAAGINVNSSGLTAGNWYVPNVEEMYWFMSKITYGLSGITTSNCDQFNKTLSKIGGNLVSCAQNRWSCVRSSYRNAWYFPNAGGFGHNAFNYALRASFVSALQVTGA